MTAAHLHWLVAADVAELVAAGDLFDRPPDARTAADFLGREGHHLCLAYVDGRPVGFVAGIEIAHADHVAEMYCDELAVDAAHRNRGVGTALMDALADRARERGCAGMWVLTEEDNLAARRTYVRAGAGDSPQGCVLYEWDLGGR